MERAAKRPRLGSFLTDDADADDELFLDPAEVNAQRDPTLLLEHSRAVASYKLKSRWEDVFAKFEKDFAGEDDIINFYTDELPEVVVDNGHLRSLADADDAKSVAGSDSADLDEEERILQGNGTWDGQLIRAGSNTLTPRPAYGGRLSGLDSLASGRARPSTMFSTGVPLQSFSPPGLFSSLKRPLQSIWNAPELPPEAFNNHTIATTSVRRRVPVKALPAPEDDTSDEDDILMGNTASWIRDQGKLTDRMAAPRVEVLESRPASDNAFLTGLTTETSQTKGTMTNEVATRSKQRKVGRPQAMTRETLPAGKHGPDIQEAVPEPAHTTQAGSVPPLADAVRFSAITHVASAIQGRAKPINRRKPGWRKALLHEYAPAFTECVPEQPAPETPQITEINVGAQQATGQAARRRPGRPQRHSLADSLVKKASAKKRSEVPVVPDSDVELQQSFPTAVSDVDRLDGSGNDISSTDVSLRATKSVFCIEVQLFRRPRPDNVRAQEDLETPLLAPDSPEERERQVDPSCTGEENGADYMKTQNVCPPSMSTTRKNRVHGQKGCASPVGSVIPAKNSSVCQSSDLDGMTMRSHAVPATHLLAPSQKTDEQFSEGVAPTEQFSRNNIDDTYAFSDEDEAFLPYSRAKTTAAPAKKLTSTSTRALAESATDSSATSRPSPSIHTDAAIVKKKLLNSSSTGPGATTTHEPETVEITAGEISSPPLRLTQERGASAAEIDEHGNSLPPESDDSLSLPVPAGAALVRNDNIPTTPSCKQPMEEPAPPPATCITPSSRRPKSKPTATRSTTRQSTSKRSILSLLSDSDEDELSLSLDQISPLVRSPSAHHLAIPIRSRSTVKKPAMKRLSMRASPRVIRGQKKSRFSDGWDCAFTNKLTSRTNPPAPGEGELHRTPGGTLRRCGEDGFKCERDFCFACL